MEISWERVRSIFNDPQPPRTVWERQFDYFDDELRRLASTPYESIDFGDMWYYHHDLAYVELQADLFAYLFPVCLMDWHATLLADHSCSHGDSEFHYGIHHGKVLEKMLTHAQRQAVFEFFCDSFLIRLDRQRRLESTEGPLRETCWWLARFNSLAIVMPRIDMIWNSWWSLNTPGRSVAAVQYCSLLIYFDDFNPFFLPWTPNLGNGTLWWNDSRIYYSGWAAENVQFLQSTLTSQFVVEKIRKAVENLQGEPEFATAQRVEHDLAERMEILESRIKELPKILASGDDGPFEIRWSV